MLDKLRLQAASPLAGRRPPGIIAGALDFRDELRREAKQDSLVHEVEMQRSLANHDAERHREHLCHLVETRQMATVESLVGDGRFICAQCGRVAAEARNLCDPVARPRFG